MKNASFGLFALCALAACSDPATIEDPGGSVEGALTVPDSVPGVAAWAPTEPALRPDAGRPPEGPPEVPVDTGEPAPPPIAPALVTLPSVTGTPEVGATLTASPGEWAGTEPITFAYQWRRCDLDGAGCADLAGETGPAYTLTGHDPMHTVEVRVTATNEAGDTVAEAVAPDPSFAPGTVCNATGEVLEAPAVLDHVIVILMENRDMEAVHDHPDAPYFNELRAQCASSDVYADNLFPWDITSLPHYLALVSGSNCDAGLASAGTNCVTDMQDPGDGQLATDSIFSQVGDWKAYQEDMPSNCHWGNPAQDTRYYVKHNPAAFFSNLNAECGTKNVGFPTIECSEDAWGGCTAPQNNAFVDDLLNDTLPAFSFVTADIVNGSHDTTVTVGDNWLSTYLPLILDSAAYRRGGTMVYVLWDEQGSFTSGAQPNLFLSPYAQHRIDTTTEINHFAALRAMETQLGIGTHLGCAGGTPPGGVGTCPPGSTEDLRAIFGF